MDTAPCLLGQLRVVEVAAAAGAVAASGTEFTLRDGAIGAVGAVDLLCFFGCNELVEWEMTRSQTATSPLCAEMTMTKSEREMDHNAQRHIARTVYGLGIVG